MALKSIAKHRPLLLEHGLRPGSYALTTIHKGENTDENDRLRSIFEGLKRVVSGGTPVVACSSCRTKKMLHFFSISYEKINTISPVSYEKMFC